MKKWYYMDNLCLYYILGFLNRFEHSKNFCHMRKYIANNNYKTTLVLLFLSWKFREIVAESINISLLDK